MKMALRKRAKQIRDGLDMVLISKELEDLVRENQVYKNAKNIMLYYPLPNEVNLLGLLSDDKNFSFPKVNGSELLVCPYTQDVNLEKSNLGIFEPCSKPVSSSVLDLVIVPALMIDYRGYRLGYGGGFYDRFLKKSAITSMSVVPKSLIIDELPIESFDIPVDIVISA